MLFGAEGVHGDGRATTGGATLQHACVCVVVRVLALIGATRVPLCQFVQYVEGERGVGTVVVARGLVAPAIVAGTVGRAGWIATGGTKRIEPADLVWLAAVAVEILLIGACAIERTLPQLSQVRVGIAGAISGALQTIGRGTTATGAIPGGGNTAIVACPDESVLFVVAEDLGLVAP